MGNCLARVQAEVSNKEGKTSAHAAVKAKNKDRDVEKAPSSFTATHQAVKLLGRGMAGDTWLFRDTSTERLVAVKLYPRPIPDIQHESTLREIKTQTDLAPGHVSLINVYEAILTPQHLGLVMEWAAGGCLTTRVADRFPHSTPGSLIMGEDEARFYFTQFVDAVGYCHKHNIAHRDLKLDNALLDDNDPPMLKICDFGFARYFGGAHSKLERVNSHLGTPEYMSPELLHNGIANTEGRLEDYDPRRTDVWAAGVMLVVTLLGAFPFDHTKAHNPGTTDDELDLWLQEVNQSWDKSSTISANVGALSEGCKDLLDKIFVVDPKQRITIAEIIQHPWFCQEMPEPYAHSLEKMREQNQALAAHVSKRTLDRGKVELRDKELRDIVDRGCEKELAAGSHHSLRPLHTLDLKKAPLKRVNLTEEYVLAKGPDPESESPIVTERCAPSQSSSNLAGKAQKAQESKHTWREVVILVIIPGE